MNFPMTKELLFDYFNGHASALQKQSIDEWARLPENEEFFYKCLVEWELAHPQYGVNVSSAIDRYRDFVAKQASEPLSAPGPVPSESPTVSRRFFSGYWAAAVAVLLLAGGLFRSELLTRTYATEPGQIRTWTLADGSRVTLNSNSILQVPRFGFGGTIPGRTTREVRLTGEAEFSVTHQSDNRRFVVKTANFLDVVVLGTEFTVYSRDRRMQVALNRGKVVLQGQKTGQESPIVLKPGDVVTLVREKIQRKHVRNPEQFSAWKDHLFVFDATPLVQVAQMLRENYGLTVAIADPEIAQETVSGSFKAMNADELLKSLSKALDIQAIRRGKKVTFSARAPY